ncbi:MAG: MMPL family transporter, partial [Gammaproteobacteria bacterium]
MRKLSSRLLSLWVTSVQRFSIAVLVAAVLLAGFCLQYTRNNLGMNTDTLDMLSAELPWRQLDNHYKQEFPQYRDSMAIVVEAATPDQAADAAKFLYNELLALDKDLIDLFHAGSLSVFTESALLYLDQTELQQLADRLARIQPFLGTLTDDPTLTGLFSMLTQVIKAMDDGEEIDIRPLLSAINQAIDDSAADANRRMSWQLLIDPEPEGKPVYREFILLKPQLDYNSLTPAADILRTVRDLLQRSGLQERYGVKVRISGSVALQHEELAAVTQGTKLAAMLALIMVTCIMLAGLRSLKLMLFTLFNLLVGLIVTAAFATLTVGKLNLISVAFTVLYIGLGVDFAIHFCLRYRELLLRQSDNNKALEDTAVNIGSALFICALSTAVGFFAFIPTDYKGVAELGWIAGFGMFFSFIFTMTLLPALFALFPLQVNPGAPARPASLGRLSQLPIRYCKSITFISALLFIAALSVASGIRFDPNTLNLQDPKGEAVQTWRDLLADKTTTPWTAVTLATDEQQANRIAAMLAELSLVDKSVSVHDFIPAEQDAKLAVVDELGLLLGELSMRPTQAFDETATRTAMAELNTQLAQAKPAVAIAELTGLQTRLTRLLQQDTARLQQLQGVLLHTLPGRIAALNDSLNADYITLATLPEGLRKRWLSDNGHYRIEIFPTQDLQDQTAMREFVDALRAADINATGAPVISLSASDAVAGSFRQAFLYAFTAITLLLLLLFRHKRDVLYVLAPLLMATVFTAALATLLGMQLDFANIIALPLLLGIGVDSGVHIMHRFRTGTPADGNVLH